MSKKASSKLTKSNLEDVDPRRIVGVTAERVTHVSSTDYPGHYPHEDHSWNLDTFKKSVKVGVKRLSQRSIEFDMVAVDASIANAFRRIMIAEVPTIAIEHVYVWDNTGVLVDEVLAHRLGLVPLNVDPNLIEMKESSDAQATDQNTVVFDLKLQCTYNPKLPSMTGTSKGKGAAKPSPSTSTPVPHSEPLPDSVLYVNHELKSGHLVWRPAGEQEDVFGPNEETNERRPGPINPNIVLTKLRPGQGVEVELHAVKGVGKDHAKFSPVATATYRLLPHIKILSPIPLAHVEKFQKCFAPGVIHVDPRTKDVSVDPVAVRKDWVTREVLRHPEFEGKVQLGRVRDHFLFNVESESAYKPEQLLPESIKVMRAKLAAIRKATEALAAPPSSQAHAQAQDGDVNMA